MRSIPLLIAGTVVASCSMAPPPPPPPPTPAAMHEMDRLIGGKVAQAPISCLPSYRADDMVRIDGRTLGFRVGGNTSYIVHLSPGCESLTSTSATLVSHQPGGNGLCVHDIQRVIDSSAIPVGSCTIEEIVPYVRP